MVYRDVYAERERERERRAEFPNLVFYRQDTVGVLRELSHRQDAVVRRSDDIVLC